MSKASSSTALTTEGTGQNSPLAMLPGIQLPSELKLMKHKVENWKTFKQQWNSYAIIAQLEKYTEGYKVAMF